jgi:uncharacterized protein YcgL (UPF0745 family)
MPTEKDTRPLPCVVYKSLRKQDTYLYVPAEDAFSAVPEALRAALGRLEEVMRLELTPQTRLARDNARQIIDDLRNQGFHLQVQQPELVSNNDWLPVTRG